MLECPVCHRHTLETSNVYRAEHVALGMAVCSWECHTEAYHLEQYYAVYPINPIAALMGGAHEEERKQ